MNSRIVKIAVAGAIFAVAVDYFLKPAVNSTLKLS